ncbi:hypothetical protein B0H14DRAFT_3691667, partial [Mycena olivaceomarginata]
SFLPPPPTQHPSTSLLVTSCWTLTTLSANLLGSPSLSKPSQTRLFTEWQLGGIDTSFSMASSQRTLCSGKEFSAFDMVVGCAALLSTPEYFDIADCLAKRIQEQEATCMIDEPVNDYHESNDPDPLPFLPSASSSPSLTRSHWLSYVYGLQEKLIQTPPAALGAAIQFDVDIDTLPHSEPAWIGKQDAQDNHTFEDSMGSRIYSQKEIRELTGVDGMRYINWLGVLTIPITDSLGQIIAILGGTAHDTEGWRAITDHAANLMEAKANQLSHSEEELHHCRAQEPYPLRLLRSFLRWRSGMSFKTTKPIPRSQTSLSSASSVSPMSYSGSLPQSSSCNGFKTDHIFGLTTTKEEKREWAEEAKTRWQEGVAMYSTVDSLQS